MQQSPRAVGPRRPGRRDLDRGHRPRSAGHGALTTAQQGGRLCRIAVAVRQHVCCDLAGAGVDTQVQLEPAPAGPTVRGRAPLALTEQLKPRAVQLQVDRFGTGLPTRLASGEGASPSAKSGVVRQRHAEQLQHAAGKPLRLTQGQVDHAPQRQHQLQPGQSNAAGHRACCGAVPASAPPPPRPPRPSGHRADAVPPRRPVSS